MKRFRDWFSLKPWNRHSLVTLVGGLGYIATGVLFVDARGLSERQERTWEYAVAIMPLDMWGLLYILVGLIVALSSIWPRVGFNWGYSLLTGLAAAWSSIYLLGYFFGDAPKSNLYFGLSWGLTAFTWWAVSGLLNPDRRAVQRHGSS